LTGQPVRKRIQKANSTERGILMPATDQSAGNDPRFEDVRAETPPKAGSKQAVLKHFGIFKDDEDLEERLADARRRREEQG
jgi:hypothetical protein